MSKLLAVLLVGSLLFWPVSLRADVSHPDVVIKNGADSRFYREKDVGVFLQIEGIANLDAAKFTKAVSAFKNLGLKKIRMVINSPGGNLFAGVHLAQAMMKARAEGMVIETRGYGMIASAALLIFSAGSPGHRFVAPGSVFLYHQVAQSRLFDTADLQEQRRRAKQMEKMQNIFDSFLKMSGVNIDEVRKEFEKWGKEYIFFSGKAIELGFADGLLYKFK